MKEQDLLALLNEKYGMLRKRCEQLWNQGGHVRISASEWCILSKISCGGLSISEIARAADITRQAAHKYVNGLQGKGLVSAVSAGDSRRQKRIALTDFGSQCWTECLELEQQVERQIGGFIGEDTLVNLRKILESNWLVPEK